MERILKNQKVRGLFLISILVLVWCCPSDFWQRPAFGDKAKDHIILSPKEGGSVWNLPAGVYGEDEDDQGGSNTGPGGSPSPTGPAGDVGPGGSPSKSK